MRRPSRPSFNLVCFLVACAALGQAYAPNVRSAVDSLEVPGAEGRVLARVESKPSVTIVCTVPRHPDNRWLTIGIPGQTSSLKQLNGVDSLMTFRLAVPHSVECDGPTLDAVCLLQDQFRTTYSAVTTFICPNFRPSSLPH